MTSFYFPSDAHSTEICHDASWSFTCFESSLTHLLVFATVVLVAFSCFPFPGNWEYVSEVSSLKMVISNRFSTKIPSLINKREIGDYIDPRKIFQKVNDAQ